MNSFNQKIAGRIIRALLVLSFLAKCGVSYSQVNSVVTIPQLGSPTIVAPNAASLGKYGEIPVSYYTGIPNITIPIYEIKSGSLDIPVSLSYHAGGNRVEEIASWVGLGWSLNAGGVISRQVRGVADEANGGYLQVYDTLNSFLNGTMSTANQLYYFQQVEAGNWDSQQDIFNYNVGGESGKFLLDSTGSTLTIPSTRNKFQLVTYNGTANCWKMTDINGVQYYFANKETTQTTPVINGALSPSPSPTVVTSWYLTKIVNAQGTDSINFTYTAVNIKTSTSTAQTKYLLDQNLGGGTCATKNPDSKSSSSSVMGVRLGQITFRNGSIIFTANSQQRCDLYTDNALSSIQVKNLDSSFDKIYQCYQHYTSSTRTVLCDLNDEVNNHLFLDSLRFSDAAGGNVGEYKLAYNTAVLPSRLSYDQDYWGFYNAAGNTSFIPTIDQVNPENGGVLELPGANRNPSSSNQAGILQSITYPTGGSTVFQYETNTASNYFSATIGGIDIVDSTHYFDILTLPPSKKVDTTFQMNDNYDGLGGVNATVTVDNGGGACAEESQLGCPIVTLYDPAGDGTAINSSSTMFLTQGTYRVTIDLSTVQNSTIIDNFAFGVKWQSGESEVPALKNNETVGGLRIKSITNYTENDSVADIRSYQYLFPDSTSYSSGFVLSLPEYTGTIATQAASSQDGGGGLSSCTYYTYSSGSHYPLTATQSSYVGYKYVTELLGSNGQFGENIYTYEAPDLIPDLGNVGNFPYPPSTSEDWKRGQALHRQSYRFNQNTGQYELISEKISQFTPLTVANYANFQVARNTFYSGGIIDDGGLADYTYSMFNTIAGWTPLMNDTDRVYDQNNLSSYNQKATAYTYSNVHYQPLSITTNNSNGETTTAHMTYPLDYTGLTATDAFTQGVLALQNSNIITPVIEKYVTRSSPSGTLIGTTQSVLTSFWSQYLLPDSVWSTQYTSPSTGFQPLTVRGGSLVRDGSYVPQLAQIRYDAHSNAVEELKINDMLQSYLWDYNGEYPICKVINADSGDIAYTSFEADGTGNWVISAGALDPTTGFTGLSSYNLNGSISKYGLNSATTYIVSYWTLNKVPFTIAGTISGYPVQGKTETINNNSWTLFVHKVTGQSTITVNGIGHIDELRLYPSTAQMTTYTYSPLVGMTSQTDVGNRVTYYEYDGLQRLKRIRDQDYNILKTLEYQYQKPAGCTGCQSLAMETFLGTNTIGYPVGIFDIHGNLVGNATGAAAYVRLWNSDTADARVGTLSIGNDSLHFNIVLKTGQTLPASVTGCRYFQYDLAWTQLDAVRNFNGTYVDFGDSTGMHLGATPSDTPAVIAPRTTYATLGDGSYPGYFLSTYFVHNYLSSSLKTITFYHNDAQESPNLDNVYNPATSLTKLQNFRGNIPLSTTLFGGSSYQQSSATTVANISNWSTVHTIENFFLNSGDAGLDPYTNITFTQDFMQYNPGLLDIELSHGYYYVNYYDSTFKVSTLKSDWNTYFANLQTLLISDDQWNREDLSGLKHLNNVFLAANNQNHSSNQTNNPVIPLPTQVTDNVINQVAAGAGQTIFNGVINIATGGAGRTSASQAAVDALIAKGWTIYIDGIAQPK